MPMRHECLARTRRREEASGSPSRTMKPSECVALRPVTERAAEGEAHVREAAEWRGQGVGRSPARRTDRRRTTTAATRRCDSALSPTWTPRKLFTGRSVSHRSSVIGQMSSSTRNSTSCSLTHRSNATRVAEGRAVGCAALDREGRAARTHQCECSSPN